MRFVGNYDGDTIKVNIVGVPPLFGEGMSVRVVGVDSPEIKSRNTCERELAVKAKDFVSQQLSVAQRIDLKNVKDDKYFRILADVVYDGKSLSEELLRVRLAVPYDGGTKQKVDWCQK